MALIDWNEALSVQIASVDVQHRKLVGLINALDDAMRQGKGSKVVSRIVASMTSYTVTHFRMEEMLLAEHDYPGVAGHRREHQFFAEKVDDFERRLRAGTGHLSIELMGFLSEWLQAHIKGMDQKYAPFLAEKGVT